MARMKITALTVDALAVAALAIILAACGGGRVGALSAEQYNAAPLTVAIAQGTANAVVIDAAEQALTGRGWRVVSRSGDEIVGKLVHRNYDAIVTIRIEGSQAALYSDATIQSADTDGPTPAVPYGWLKNLKSDMEANLAR